MQQIRDLSDERNRYFCIHCGRGTETKDHAPSKIFLDEPYPDNLPVVGACRSCNLSFSLDEEYVACAIECAMAASIDPEGIRRHKVKLTLQNKPKLTGSLENSLSVDSEGHTIFNLDSSRLIRVILKLARSHVAYELGTPHPEQPIQVNFCQFSGMGHELHDSFESLPETTLIPEMGSRAMQRLLMINNRICFHWVIVQEDQYRYLVYQSDLDVVRIVISEYLACEVAWG